jgi:hypothetical protein
MGLRPLGKPGTGESGLPPSIWESAGELPRMLAVMRWIVCVPVFFLVLSGADAMDPSSVTLEQVRAKIEPAESPHPRLMLTARDFDAVKEKVATDADAKALFDALRASADAILGREPIRYEKQGRRLLHQSRECNQRVSCLAMVYRLTGEERYLDRAKRELLAPVGFPDWNPSHFLDTAEMTYGLAIGYDWLHDALDEGTRRRVREGIVRHGLEPAMRKKGNGWIRANNNWGQVCHGGITAGALALMEDDPERAAFLVHRAVTNVVRSTEVYSPSGTYPEGPSYWSYGTSYNVILITCLESALGSDFGLAGVPGFDRTAEFLNQATGPTGQYFNYADCSASSQGLLPAVWWFARRFERPDWLACQWPALREATGDKEAAGIYGSRCVPALLHWMMPYRDVPVKMGLHWNGVSDNPVTMHRSAWGDPDALFVGLKAGTPRANHGHMDVGSFVFDAEGVRWAHDLGKDGYHQVESRGLNLWDRGQDSDRWRVFRNGTEAHGTLMIDGEDQRVGGMARTVRFSGEQSFPHSVIDMSGLYRGKADSVCRGVALAGERQLIVRDRLEGLRPGSELRWAMVTKARVEVAGPGRAVLEQAGKAMQLRVISPADVELRTWDVSEARNEWDSPNRGAKQVGFLHRAGGDRVTDIVVTLTAGAEAADPPERALSSPLEWSSPIASESR